MYNQLARFSVNFDVIEDVSRKHIYLLNPGVHGERLLQRVFLALMFFFLLISSFALAFNIQQVKAEPRTWTVDDSGGADFTRIQDANTAANPGDTIYVYNGTYYEDLVFNKSLTIIGESKFDTIIDGMGSGAIITISGASNLNLTGFTIRNTGEQEYDAAVTVYGSSSCCVCGNIIRDVRGASWVMGIQVWDSHGITVVGNTISSIAECAIYGVDQYDNAIVDNTISDCHLGIYVESSCQDYTVVGNTVSNCSGDAPLGILVWGSNHRVIDNTISDCQAGIYLGDFCQNITVVGNTVSNCSGDATYGILVWGSDNRVINNTVANVPYTGMRLNSPSESPNACTNNVFSGNVVSNASNGIEVGFASFFNMITGNNVSDCGSGIILSSNSNNNTAANNILQNNSLGIGVYGQSNNSTLSGNIVVNNNYGIDIFDSSNTEIFKNNLTANTYSNIYSYSSFGNKVHSNLISNSQNGLMFLNSSNSHVFHNNIINNTEQVYCYDSINVWDNGYPSGGNYWSDYTGIDANSDGIGDTPYAIDANNTDRYPLMQPYVPNPADINQDGTVDIFDAILAAPAFGTRPGDSKWDSMADLNQDDVIDIFDFIMLASNFGRTEA